MKKLITILSMFIIISQNFSFAQISNSYDSYDFGKKYYMINGSWDSTENKRKEINSICSEDSNLSNKLMCNFNKFVYDFKTKTTTYDNLSQNWLSDRNQFNLFKTNWDNFNNMSYVKNDNLYFNTKWNWFSNWFYWVSKLYQTYQSNDWDLK